MRYTPFIFIALLTSHCGVEAGNVGKGRTGQVKVMFAQESTSSSESLSVSVGSLSLLDSADSEAATMAATVGSVDLYGSANESVLVAESSGIPVGNYAKIAIRLKGEKPVRYRDESGRDHDVSLDEETKDSFFIAQAIEVVEGKTTTIIVNLDPYQSLSKPSTDAFVFKPRGEVSREELRYKGTTSVSGARFACVYAYQTSEGPVGPLRASRQGDDGRDDDDDEYERRPPPGTFLKGRGREVEDRPTFGSKGELVKDETADCSKAYAKTRVKDGKFEFRYLRAGTYAVRIFASDGSYTDLADDIVMKREE